ncbi:glucose 1-dehydrogenase [Weissella paramesenteroides]|jgi:NAD(P)-dependent dehydrogenase (short-subunit alcohol dehydrogenase family)|uniref:Oxidoreductase, short chain dehydrogenase/reductase family protein n=1 Tax=Weissella paramesenteroides ATCC 33313 TaxID=585506 RepID=C5RBI4_WEIPA|nr:SDR family oxidoreductase [Weissella paramesenteroides]ATF41105.1 3-oxoacyl-ACP reductase [Weissella paramesenteroides]EER74458.1 oxidoreductase, short chain dehydrogenase/reductase family protein [Weissella paramesenteroides ATCC 33313]KAA8440890.1 glucose 1-dehydrogenase [Weissella paramesenteroides]KAA8441850.1 glucose 1-dehydrogenase [Weissella paramesenteroides]KAA8443321.1 glucose 1-dehydrogenase [Weissella paramesenteroides]
MGERLKGKVAIVTGGSLGIGWAIANRFVQEGAKVVITGRREQIGEEAAQKIGTPDVIRFIQHDSSDEAGWVDLFDQTEQIFGPVSTLVNNAGIAVGNSIENTTTEEWRQIMAVNLDGVFFGTRLGIQRMKNKDLGASIINMSSIEGFVGDSNLGAYNASKGAVRIMSKSAAVDCALKDYDIRINSVHPGYIRTPMVESTPGMVEAMSQRSKTPMGHLGEPDDIAYMCVFLASDESKFATGSEFVVDGGYTAQ